MSLRVDPDELDNAAKKYTTSADSTAESAEAFPTSVKAGIATTVLAGMLAQVAEDTAGLIEASIATGEALEQCATAYRTARDELAFSILNIWSEEVL